jgi:hypothetical protein
LHNLTRKGYGEKQIECSIHKEPGVTHTYKYKFIDLYLLLFLPKGRPHMKEKF